MRHANGAPTHVNCEKVKPRELGKQLEQLSSYDAGT